MIALVCSLDSGPSGHWVWTRLTGPSVWLAVVGVLACSTGCMPLQTHQVSTWAPDSSLVALVTYKTPKLMLVPQDYVVSISTADGRQSVEIMHLEETALPVARWSTRHRLLVEFDDFANIISISNCRVLLPNREGHIRSVSVGLRPRMRDSTVVGGGRR